MDIRKAIAFNCPACGAGISEPCISKRGTRMASYAHHGREPTPPRQNYTRLRLRNWLKENAHIFEVHE